MKRIKLLFVLCLVMIVLQSNVWVKLTLVQPAQITLPKHLKRLVIVDRTKQIESVENKLEQTLTGEFFEQDEQAVAKLIEGTINLCSGFQRFELIRTGKSFVSDGTKNTFPTPPKWDDIIQHCEKHSADGIMSIEIFDTDFIVTNNPFEEEVKDKDGNITKVTKYIATGVTVINVGIRIYDPLNRQIVDEFRVTERFNTDATGINVNDAVNGLLDKVEAINQTSYNVGYAFGKRISPYYYTVKRVFYEKPKKSEYLQEGVRKSKVADWEGAIHSWMKVLQSKKKQDVKAYGRASYNIAVAFEVLGDLDKAKKWAAKSYTEYEDKEADEYYKLLQKRIRKEAIVETQLAE